MQNRLKSLLKQDDTVQTKFLPGQQRNYYTGLPYTPIRIDPRWNRGTNTQLRSLDGYEHKTLGNSNVFGEDSLPARYTRTGILGQMAAKALARLANNYTLTGQPFSLSVHFNAPHPPMGKSFLRLLFMSLNNS